MSRKAAITAWDEAVGVKRKSCGAGTLGWALGEYRQSPSYRRLSPNTKKLYERSFNRLHEYRNQPMNGLLRRHVVKMRNDMAETPAAANNLVVAIQALCRFAVESDYIDINPALEIERLELGSWRRWTDAEMKGFYAATYEAMRRVFVLALYTGQRCSDLCKARWDDIDGKGVWVVQQKTGRKLWIPVHPMLRMHLDEWSKDTVTLTILRTTTGRPWTANVLSAAFSREVKERGVTGCTLHGLRKTAGAMLAEAGCSTKQIQSILGHTTLSEVERYTEEADQRKMATAAIRRLAGPSLKMVCNPLISKAA